MTVTVGMAWFRIISISSWKGLASRVLAPRQRSMVVYRWVDRHNEESHSAHERLQCWNLACAMTGAFLVDLVGRRPLFITSTAGMFIGRHTHTFILIAQLTKDCSVFCMWTLTTALFNALHNTAAAKGINLLNVHCSPFHWFGIKSATVPLIL